MGQGKRIGLIYRFNESWIGGTYYIQNIIRALNYLPEMEKMRLHVLTKDKSTFQDLQNSTNYPNLKFVRYATAENKIQQFINRITYKFFKKKWFVKNIKLDCVFPVYEIPRDLKHVDNLIFWIPDFQEKYFPDFFSSQEIISRQTCYEVMVSSNQHIVFSSNSALDDFNTFFPNAKNKKSVLQFAVIHPNLDSNPISELKEKYAINGNYFISPNQFWQHKNQIVIIEAVKILKDNGIEVKIIFTGKEHDYRNPNYVIDLKNKVIEYNLEKQIYFLGFIDRNDQLLLIKNANAVIQPSLFEGWSTVVEDAKALNQTIIASNILVHKEQLGDYAYYFNPNNPNELAKVILELTEEPENKLKYELNYNIKITEFAQKFISIINE